MLTLAFLYIAEARGITSVVGRLYNITTIVSIKKNQAMCTEKNLKRRKSEDVKQK